MPRLQPSAFVGIPQASLQRLLFVGITRATRWVYFSSREGDALPVMKRLETELAGQFLAVQVAGGENENAVGQAPPVAPGGLSDLL